MVVLTPAEVARINHDMRLKILEYVLAKGMKPRDLGVTSSLLTKIKHGYRSVSDALLIAALRFLSPDEFRAIMGEPEAVVLRPDGLKKAESG